LENVIERAVLLASEHLVQPKDITSDASEVFGAATAVSSMVQRSMASSPARNPAGPAGGAGEGMAPTMSIWEMERTLIFQTLERVNGNRTHAAKLLEISIRTLRNKLREYRQLDTASANVTGQELPGAHEVSLNESPV
jgi:two-component system response regulator FlrC